MQDEKKYPEGRWMGVGIGTGIGIGMPIGLIIGVLMDNIPIGIAGTGYRCRFRLWYWRSSRKKI